MTTVRPGSAFEALRPADLVMCPAGLLVPGDVLRDGSLVLGTDGLGGTVVLAPRGRVERLSYGEHFNLTRLRRPGEG